MTAISLGKIGDIVRDEEAEGNTDLVYITGKSAEVVFPRKFSQRDGQSAADNWRSIHILIQCTPLYSKFDIPPNNQITNTLQQKVDSSRVHCIGGIAWVSTNLRPRKVALTVWRVLHRSL